MAKLLINENKRLGKISPEIYGHFSEHLGRCIYEGLYVGEVEVNDVKSIISPTVVNAYYNPLDNSINFPASLKELYKESDN